MTCRRAFDDHPVTIYSNFIEWLGSLSMRSAPAKQWIATIISAKGMREEEVNRSGLISFLSQFDATQKIHKDQLLSVAKEGLSTCQISVRTERTTIYRPALQSASFSQENIPQKVLDTFSDAEIISCHKLESYNYKVVRLKFTGMFGSGESWFVFDEHWRQFKPSKSYRNAVDAIDFLYTVAADRFSDYSSQAPRNYYERYSLLGENHNYKEWVVTLPYWKGGFERSHFDLMNVVLHIRTSEWKDINNQPLLLIDEIQSDWHAFGRENGYYEIGENVDSHERDAVPDAPFKKEWHELGIKLAIWIALKSGHHRVAFTTANIHKSRYEQDLEGFHLLYDHLIPKTLAKLTAKFQCSIKSAIIKISEPNESIHYKRGLGWELCAHGQTEKTTIIKNEVVAMRYLESRGQKKKEEVRTFEISSVLVDTVKSKGLPLFGWW